jgi:hypothetical protein
VCCKFGVVSSGSEMDGVVYGRYPEVGVQCGICASTIMRRILDWLR